MTNMSVAGIQVIVDRLSQSVTRWHRSERSPAQPAETLKRNSLKLRQFALSTGRVGPCAVRPEITPPVCAKRRTWIDRYLVQTSLKGSSSTYCDAQR